MIRRLAAAAVLLLGIAEIANLLGGYHPHGAFWNRIPLSDTALGFLGGAALVLVATRWLKPLLSRSEDYYPENRP